MDSLKENGEDASGGEKVQILPKRWNVRHVLKAQKSWCVGGALLFGGIVLLNSAMITYFTPRKYLGQVQVHLLGDRKPGETQDAANDRIDFDVEMAAIESKRTLERAILVNTGTVGWKLGVPNEVSDEACDILRSKLKVIKLPGTPSISIDVYDSDSQEAANLAAIIGRSYYDLNKERASIGNGKELVHNCAIVLPSMSMQPPTLLDITIEKVRVFFPTDLPARLVRPNIRGNLLCGLGLGLVAAVGGGLAGAYLAQLRH